MEKHFLIGLAFLVTLVSCHERTDKDISNKFIGTWTLVRCIAIQQDGTISFPYGEKPVGQILYDTKGNVMVEITNQEIKKFSSENPFLGTPDEIIPAYNGLLAYYGKYKILADSSIIVHSITASSFPNWVGQDQARRFEFKNNNLILRTPSISSVQYELTWEKIGKSK